MSIKLSREEEYGIIALIDLSRNGHQVERVKVIADRQNIPSRFLEQIFTKLRQANIVVGKRGPTGGYRLSESADKITLSRVVNALRPEAKAEDVVNRGNIARVVNSAWGEIEKSFNKTLEKMTLADLSNKASRLSKDEPSQTLEEKQE